MAKAQGATEYLVLLAVVLIVALVSVALLGFFPGMASDAQITQSKTYWQSAQPISIVESAAVVYGAGAPERTMPYIRIRNSGAYPIRITKLLGTNGQSISQLWVSPSNRNISDYYYLAPGEESYFADSADGGIPHFSVPAQRYISFSQGSSGSSTYNLQAAASICNPLNSSNPGTLVMNDFGFEYIEYIENQPITKRQVGKPLVIKCS